MPLRVMSRRGIFVDRSEWLVTGWSTGLVAECGKSGWTAVV